MVRASHDPPSSIPRPPDDLQLRTSLASRGESSVLNSWINFAHNPSGSARRSLQKLFPESTFLLARSDTGVRARKIRNLRLLIPSSSPPAPVRSVWVSRAKIPIGRVASAHVPSVMARSPSSGIKLWLSSVVVIPPPRRLHVSRHVRPSCPRTSQPFPHRPHEVWVACLRPRQEG